MVSLYIMQFIYKKFLYGFFIMGLSLQRFVDIMKYIYKFTCVQQVPLVTNMMAANFSLTITESKNYQRCNYKCYEGVWLQVCHRKLIRTAPKE